MPRRAIAYEVDEPSPRRQRFDEVASTQAVLRNAACLPSPGDNAAIAVDALEVGARVCVPIDGREEIITLRSSLLEGHRFASRPIAANELILSWGEPFGRALRPIPPGEWVINAKVLHALHERGLSTSVVHPNFVDYVKPAELREDTFVSGPRVPLTRAHETFNGFVRGGGRGAGTRNYLVLLPLSSRVGAFSRALEQRLKAHPEYIGVGAAFDGVVALPHTEDGGAARGGSSAAAANHVHLVRTLLGLLVHPNVGAAVVLQSADDVAVASAAGGGVSYDTLKAAAEGSGHAARLASTPHLVRTLALHEFGVELADATAAAASLLPDLRAACRQPCAASALVVAQQCGGSDAFSGTAANPLLADASKLLVEAGGAALLAETDELIGAEQYVLQNVADYPTARRFLDLVSRFRQYADEHNTSAEGNPSGGNMLRGLYNIALKSLGAAMKRHPQVRLERVIEYAELLPIATAPEIAEIGDEGEGVGVGSSTADGAPAFGGCVGPGYCFMDSPGNDLESIAGQVAAGCNVIYFSTGNGSITNFPFVPTIKVVSTSRRFALMKTDMDVDAGDVALTATERAEHLFARTLAVASGERTRGETAGHYQLQIWRNWIAGRVEPPPTAMPPAYPTASAPPTAAPSSSPKGPAGKAAAAPLVCEPLRRAPLAASAWERIEAMQYQALTAGGGGTGKPIHPTTARIALLLPTSLCSSEVARMLAGELQAKYGDGSGGGMLSGVRFAALPHTEGCGVSDERVGAATLVGHLASPLVSRCMLLEHGCEKTHNDYFASLLREHGLDTSPLGWASLQGDGGVAAVRAKVHDWFAPTQKSAGVCRHPAPLASLGVGLLVEAQANAAPLPEGVALLFARLAGQMATQGNVLIPQTSALLRHPAFLGAALAEAPRPTLAFSQRIHRADGADTAGLHIMAMPTTRWVETLTAIGASGALHMLLAWRDAGRPTPIGHPMIPMLSIALAGDGADESSAPLADIVLPAEEGPVEWNERVLRRMSELASGRYEPLALAHGNVDFQIARCGGVSL